MTSHTFKSRETNSANYLRTKSPLIQGACACGGNAGMSGQCDECKAKHLTGIQAKLKVSAPNDAYEQEADRVAEQVVSTSGTQFVSAGSNAAPALQTKKTDSTVSNKSETSLPSPVVGSNGQTFGGGERNFMENRFGHDFSNVRIHTGTSANQSADAIQAKAYTYGNNIVFAKGQYQPDSYQGKKLLAHELTHVLQQSAGGAITGNQKSDAQIFRAPASEGPDGVAAPSDDKKIARKDLIFVMDSTFRDAAKLFSPDAELVLVSSPEQMAAELQSFGSPLATLYILAHSTADAQIKFAGKNWVSANSLAATLNGSLTNFYTPRTIDFRGCSIGMDPGGMEKIRDALAATRIIGSTCYMNIFSRGPISLEGVSITNKNQLKKRGYRAGFATQFKVLQNNFKESKKCIVNDTYDGYFEAGGFLTSIYTTKILGADYSATESTCYKDLPKSVIHPNEIGKGKLKGAPTCRLVQVDVTKPLGAKLPEEETVK